MTEPLELKNPDLLRHQCYAGGEWRDATGGATFDVTNPATGDCIARVPAFTREDTRSTIEAANRAFQPWRALTGKERAQVLRRWFDLILENQDDLARIMTCEQGKPLAEARGEIVYGASFIEWFAEEAKRVDGDVMNDPLPGHRILVLKQPIGVVAAITPWNFPAAMITRKCAPALAAGCTVVVRPASETPLTALALAALAERAGLPAGTLNIITGPSREMGPELTESPLVRKLTFTGSTEVGKILMAQAASTIKKVSLELGGNAPFIVFDDADLDATIDGAMASKFRNAGQSCVCANRFLVQDGIYDAFAERLADAASRLAVGNGLDANIEQGPLINMAAVDKAEEHVADAVAGGGRVLTGGRRHALGRSFFQPTVIADATPEMLVAREETFGPVAPLFRFSDEAEAIRLANDT